MMQPIIGTHAMADRDPKLETESPVPPAPNFEAASQPSYWRTLFLDAEGLRPGWGFAFYAAMFYPLWGVAGVWAGWWHFSSASWLWSILMEEVGDFIAAAIPAIVLARVERRRWGTYGLPFRGAFGKLFWIGILWGFGGITFLLAILYGAHAFSVGSLALHGMRIFKFAAFWAVMFLFVGFFEEFLLRGYTQFTLSRGVGFWPSAVALSLVFGAMHYSNQGESWAGLVTVVVIGLFFCFTLRRTGNLWFAVGFHAAWDWGETFFYSVPDSGMVAPGHLLQSWFHGPAWLTGGTVGPEGSTVCFVVIGMLWIAFDRVYRPQKKSLDRERQSV